MLLMNIEPEEKRRTLLVVDDSEPIRKLIKAYLREGGYWVIEAVDGQEGLEICQQYAIDLILSPSTMPRMDGFSLCARLQSDTQLRAVPIIIFSASEDVQSKMRAFELGAVDYLIKPVGKDELLARIHTHLSISQLTISLQDANRELLVQQQQLLQGLHAAAELQKTSSSQACSRLQGVAFCLLLSPLSGSGGRHL